MAMALTDLLFCGTCQNRIDVGESYVVHPDVARVGPDRVDCLRCSTYVGVSCVEFGDPFNEFEGPVHRACAATEEDPE